MQQIVHVGVVLLNVVWITFFLTQGQHFSVFVQKRSSRSSNKTFMKEFCLQPESEKYWTSAVPSVSGPFEDPDAITELPSDGKRKIIDSTPATKISTIPKMQNIDITQPTLKNTILNSVRPGLKYFNGPNECCFKLIQKPMNKNLITSYYMTDTNCPVKGAILITKKARQFCVDPEEPWVKRIVTFLKNKSP